MGTSRDKVTTRGARVGFSFFVAFVWDRRLFRKRQAPSRFRSLGAVARPDLLHHVAGGRREVLGHLEELSERREHLLQRDGGALAELARHRPVHVPQDEVLDGAGRVADAVARRRGVVLEDRGHRGFHRCRQLIAFKFGVEHDEGELFVDVAEPAEQGQVGPLVHVFHLTEQDRVGASLLNGLRRRRAPGNVGNDGRGVRQKRVHAGGVGGTNLEATEQDVGGEHLGVGDHVVAEGRARARRQQQRDAAHVERDVEPVAEVAGVQVQGLLAEFGEGLSGGDVHRGGGAAGRPDVRQRRVR